MGGVPVKFIVVAVTGLSRLILRIDVLISLLVVHKLLFLSISPAVGVRSRLTVKISKSFSSVVTVPSFLTYSTVPFELILRSFCSPSLTSKP